MSPANRNTAKGPAKCLQPIEHCVLALTVFDRWPVVSIYPVESSVEPALCLNSASRVNAFEGALKMVLWPRAFSSPVDRKAHNTAWKKFVPSQLIHRWKRSAESSNRSNYVFPAPLDAMSWTARIWCLASVINWNFNGRLLFRRRLFILLNVQRNCVTLLVVHLILLPVQRSTWPVPQPARKNRCKTSKSSLVWQRTPFETSIASCCPEPRNWLQLISTWNDDWAICPRHRRRADTGLVSVHTDEWSAIWLCREEKDESLIFSFSVLFFLMSKIKFILWSNTRCEAASLSMSFTPRKLFEVDRCLA